MADQSQAQPPQIDPFAVWRNWISDSERSWNTYLNEAMSTDQYAESMGKMMDVYVNFQKTMTEAMGRFLTTMNLPTRQDILGLGDRLVAIEDRLISLEASLGRMRSGDGRLERLRPA